ncbi:MAG: hypothetical protein MZU95_16760 [Desulfomicrobium escambiense]|nr:hypothetical protein [Desulfomicrobium escambiense]
MELLLARPLRVTSATCTPGWTGSRKLRPPGGREEPGDRGRKGASTSPPAARCTATRPATGPACTARSRRRRASRPGSAAGGAATRRRQLLAAPRKVPPDLAEPDVACVYGPWALERAHDLRPEIHPAEVVRVRKAHTRGYWTFALVPDDLGAISREAEALREGRRQRRLGALEHRSAGGAVGRLLDTGREPRGVRPERQGVRQGAAGGRAGGRCGAPRPRGRVHGSPSPAVGQS